MSPAPIRIGHPDAGHRRHLRLLRRHRPQHGKADPEPPGALRRRLPRRRPPELQGLDARLARLFGPRSPRRARHPRRRRLLDRADRRLGRRLRGAELLPGAPRQRGLCRNRPRAPLDRRDRPADRLPAAPGRRRRDRPRLPDGRPARRRAERRRPRDRGRHPGAEPARPRRARPGLRDPRAADRESRVEPPAPTPEPAHRPRERRHRRLARRSGHRPRRRRRGADRRLRTPRRPRLGGLGLPPRRPGHPRPRPRPHPGAMGPPARLGRDGRFRRPPPLPSPRPGGALWLQRAASAGPERGGPRRLRLRRRPELRQRRQPLAHPRLGQRPRRLAVPRRRPRPHARARHRPQGLRRRRLGRADPADRRHPALPDRRRRGRRPHGLRPQRQGHAAHPRHRGEPQRGDRRLPPRCGIR